MRRRYAVLLSGGIDSSTVAALLIREDRSAEAIFVDYGQLAASEERSASQTIANHYGLPWQEVVLRGIEYDCDGEMRGRNDLLIAVCLAVSDAAQIAIGIHSGTPYADCSEAHSLAWQRLLDVEYAGARRVFAPLLGMTKGEVVALARSLEVPMALTRSCEYSGSPCGRCCSCRDRELTLAGA